MKINIFGVGRSGTKGIQMYLTLCMLERFKKIGINYEPFLWHDILLKYYSIVRIRGSKCARCTLSPQQIAPVSRIEWKEHRATQIR